MMQDPRLLGITRGKLLLLLKRQGPCTVAHMSEQLGLTRNAIRQHLSALERDNLVTQRPVKTGPSKPALVYTLSPQAEPLFAKQYESLLSSLIQELLVREGNSSVDSLLAYLGSSAAGRYIGSVAPLNTVDRLEKVRRIMEEAGSIAEWSRVGPAVVIRDFNCPYGAVVKEHPEVCQVQHSFLRRLLDPATIQAACAYQEARCEFRISLPPEGPAAIQAQ